LSRQTNNDNISEKKRRKKGFLRGANYSFGARNPDFEISGFQVGFQGFQEFEDGPQGFRDLR